MQEERGYRIYGMTIDDSANLDNVFKDNEMEAVNIQAASAWTWENGHASIGGGWNEGINESTWLRVYDLDGKPLKDMFDNDVFVGYHSFKVSDNSLLGRIWNSSLHGAGSVRLYSKVGDSLVRSLMYDQKTKSVVSEINAALAKDRKN